MKTIFTLLLFLLGNLVYSHDSYSLYLNRNKDSKFGLNNNKLYKTDQIYKIDCEEDLVLIHNHYIKIESYPSYSVFFFDGELVGEFETKRWVNNKHMILFFMESKTYYYFYIDVN